jgi:TolA-binding protein
MANIFERLFSRQRQLEQISSQLQDMQSNYGALQQQNSILQQQLAINFRSQGGFTKYDYNNQIGYIKQGYNIFKCYLCDSLRHSKQSSADSFKGVRG